MLADYQTLVDRLSRDDTGQITPADIDDAISLAVTRYSKDMPRKLVEDVTADGTNLLPLPTGWVAGFSDLAAIEYPIGSVPPTYLDPDGYGMYDAPSGEQIQIISAVANGEAARISFGVFHTLDGSADSIPRDHREAVASYAAAAICDQLASLFSGDSDSTIQADAVDHASKARDYAARARALRTRYHNELGIDPKRNTAAGVVVDLDLRSSQGRDRLTHPGRLR